MNNYGNMRRKTEKVATGALFAALVIVLQVISSFIKFGPFSITLTLIPVVVGSIVMGARHGAWLGGLFGAITYIFCISGVDAGGAVLFAANPFFTALICIGKGVASGFFPGLLYGAVIRKQTDLSRRVGAITAALSAPVVNTGLFLVLFSLLFPDILAEWAGGTALLTYIITGLVGINFIVEFAVNAILTPAVIAVVGYFEKHHRKLD